MKIKESIHAIYTYKIYAIHKYILYIYFACTDSLQTHTFQSFGFQAQTMLTSPTKSPDTCQLA